MRRAEQELAFWLGVEEIMGRCPGVEQTTLDYAVPVTTRSLLGISVQFAVPDHGLGEQLRAAVDLATVFLPDVTIHWDGLRAVFRWRLEDGRRLPQEAQNNE